MKKQKVKKAITMMMVVAFIFSIFSVGFSAEMTKQNISASPTWNGLCLSNEYEDYSFEFINEDNVLPFSIDMVVEKDSIRYDNQKYISYVEKIKENNSSEEIIEKESDTKPGDVVLHESYIPIVDLKSLEYNYVIRLKNNNSETKTRNTYNIFIWDENGTQINTSISEKPAMVPIQINNTYNFILFVNDEIFCVGELSNFKEINNKVYISYDYLEINDLSRIDINRNSNKAEFSGYYTTVIIPKNFSIYDVKDGTNNYPIYEKVYVAQGENLETSSFRGNSDIYRSGVSSPVWYSQMDANASGGSWNATNLSTLYYSTSTNLNNSTISTNKVFYSTSAEEFMSSGCALTCMAMLYRNRNGSVTRSFDYRGVSLTNKTTDPFTMSLVNTATTNVTGTTLINGKNYYIVPRSPVNVSWATCANYYGDTAYVTTFPTSYTEEQKAASIAAKIDSYDGGVIVYFQSGSSNHYLLFTSYSLSNGKYTFTVCDPGRSTSYSQAVSTLDKTYKTYCQTLANAVSVRFMD